MEINTKEQSLTLQETVDNLYEMVEELQNIARQSIERIRLLSENQIEMIKTIQRLDGIEMAKYYDKGTN